VTDILRLLALLLIAGVALTLVAAGVSWWMEESRRLTRRAKRAFGGAPDAVIVGRGSNTAAAFSLDAGQVAAIRGGRVTVRDIGDLEGAELSIDDKVQARVWRGEPRRALESAHREAEEVSLRMVFDDARDPEFVVDLYRAGPNVHEDAGRAVQEARAWMSRIESLLTRPPAVSPARNAPADDPPWNDDEG
jgi:hypothetical protein